eukprot:5430950-Amphidinium_carterae.1
MGWKYVCSKHGNKWSVTLLIACIRHELRMAGEGNMRQTYVVKRCMCMRVYAYTCQAKMHVTKKRACTVAGHGNRKGHN